MNFRKSFSSIISTTVIVLLSVTAVALPPYNHIDHLSVRGQEGQGGQDAHLSVRGQMGQLSTKKFADNADNGDVPILVIPVQYKDIKFTSSAPETLLDNLLNGKNLSDYGASGSVSEYFKEQSKGKFIPRFDIHPAVSLPQNRSYYGSNNTSFVDKAATDMLVHAAKLLDSEKDYSIYDLDDDGIIDYVILIYAGQGEASFGVTSSVWPYTGSLSEAKKTASINGLDFDVHSCINEWENTTPIGPGQVIFELSTFLGLPYLGSSADASAKFTPGPWSVMDSGWSLNGGMTPPNLSAWERMMLGWLEPTDITSSDLIIIHPLSEGGSAFRVHSERDNEYFIFENRQQTGFDASLPGHGMLIWHVDYFPSVFENNTVNSIPYHQYVDLVEAGGNANSANFATLASYPWPGTDNRTEFSASTVPAFVSWNGREIPYPLSDITESSDGIISFNVLDGVPSLPSPENLKVKPTYLGNAEISWQSVEQADSYIIKVYDAVSGTEVRTDITPYIHHTIENLIPQTSYKIEIKAISGNYESLPAETSFTIPEKQWGDFFPETPPFTEFSNGSFTAVWESLEDAEDYLLTVYEDDYADLSTYVDFGHRSSTQMVLPIGWNWTGEASDLYLRNSIGMYGQNAPALKFNSDATLTTPTYTGGIESVEFWFNASATEETDDKFKIEVYIPECEEWHTVYEVLPLYSEEGCFVNLKNLPKGSEALRFSFYKESGNLALDDISIRASRSKPKVHPLWNHKSVGNTTECRVEIPETTSTRLLYQVQAVNSRGELSAESVPTVVELPYSSGLTDPETSKLSIVVNGLEITVETASEGDIIRLYDLQGILRATTTTVSGKTVIVAPTHGLYILSSSQGETRLLHL